MGRENHSRRTNAALRASAIQKGLLQCGICTPGMILAAHHLLGKKYNSRIEEIKEGLSGNLCRCTGYIQIFEAVAEAARRRTAWCRDQIQPTISSSRPAACGSALSLLAEEPDGWLPIAGGTDVMVQYAAGKLPARKLVSIWGLPELRRIEVLPDEIRIGAGCTYTDLRAHELVESEFSLLSQAAALDRWDCEPRSRHSGRQYRKCIASGRLSARAAGVRGRASSRRQLAGSRRCPIRASTPVIRRRNWRPMN